MVHPASASQSCFQSPRPLERSSPLSGVDAQWTPESPIPAFRTATLVVQLFVPPESGWVCRIISGAVPEHGQRSTDDLCDAWRKIARNAQVDFRHQRVESLSSSSGSQFIRIGNILLHGKFPSAQLEFLKGGPS
jgi:hypothetical protein